MKSSSKAVLEIAEKVCEDLELSKLLIRPPQLFNSDRKPGMLSPAFPGPIWRVYFDLTVGIRPGRFGKAMLIISDEPLEAKCVFVRTKGLSYPYLVSLDASGKYTPGREAHLNLPQEEWPSE